MYDGSCPSCASHDEHRAGCPGPIKGALNVCQFCHETVFSQARTAEDHQRLVGELLASLRKRNEALDSDDSAIKHAALMEDPRFRDVYLEHLKGERLREGDFEVQQLLTWIGGALLVFVIIVIFALATK